MTTDTLPKPEREHLFLKNTAFHAFFLGLMLLFDAAGNIFFSELGAFEGPRILPSLAQVAALIMMVYYLGKLASKSSAVDSKTWWRGEFNDEYLNHLSYKGYQWIAVIWLLFLAIPGIFEGFMPAVFPDLSISDFCKLMVALGAISSGLRVGWPLLQDAD